MHKRAEIKTKIVQMLKGKTDAGLRVERMRFLPVEKSELPIILVYNLDEDAKEFDNLIEQRSAKIAVDIIAEDQDSDVPEEVIFAEDQLDVISAQVEDALIQDEYLGNMVDKMRLQTSVYAVDQESKGDIMACKMTYEVVYKVEAVSDPGNVSLETVHAAWRGGDFEDEIIISE